MVEEIKHTFEVKYLQVMNEKGEVDQALKPKLTDDELVNIYKLMVLTRKYDEKALKLQRQGRMGVYASAQGQEASQIGTAYAAKKEDWIVPGYREQGVWITRGIPIETLYQAWTGDERVGCAPKEMRTLSASIPVGSQPLHAVGIAYAMQVRKEKQAVLTYFGDGATAEGETMEAMNFAGTWKSPVVFICQNNHYAISTPNHQETGAATFAQKAIAFGFEGIQVDGNDFLAVYKATQDALEKAKRGEGPTLIECVTYRLSDHTTSDDAKKYRDEKEVEEWKGKDPILRLKAYLENAKKWNSKLEETLHKEVEEQIEKAVEIMEKVPNPEPEEMFDYIFEEITPLMKEHRDYITARKK
jgi:pyruvate dehydrogenase E1 component alpha subunit